MGPRAECARAAVSLRPWRFVLAIPRGEISTLCRVRRIRVGHGICKGDDGVAIPMMAFELALPLNEEVNHAKPGVGRGSQRLDRSL